MISYTLPLVAEADYPHLKRLPGNTFPATYREWSWDQEQHKARIKGGGHGFEEQPIDIDEYRRYLICHSAQASKETLSQFAFEKSAGKRF